MSLHIEMLDRQTVQVCRSGSRLDIRITDERGRMQYEGAMVAPDGAATRRALDHARACVQRGVRR